MRISIDLWILLIRCFFSYAVGRKDKYAKAFEGYKKGVSFSYSTDWDTDKLIPLRIAKNALQSLFQISNVSVPQNSEQPSAFYSIGYSPFHLKEYVEICAETPPKLYLNDGKTSIVSFFSKIFISLQILVISPILFVVLLFSRKRAKHSMILLELVAILKLLSTLKREQIQHLYYVGGYVRESGFLVLLLQKYKIKVQKIPSPNPLKNYYQHNISNVFTFTAPFQLQEYEFLKENWFVEQIVQWPTVGFQANLNHLQTDNHPVATNQIAICVSGIQQRRKENHLNPKSGIYEAEDKLLETMANYMVARPQLQLIIFLHPLEKKNEIVYEEAKTYYQNIFKRTPILFFDRTDSTHSHFKDAEIMITSFSTTGMDRLFCGYKTIYAPFGMRDNYFTDKNLDNIVAQEESSLAELLDKNLGVSAFDFYEQNQLWNYHYKSYLEFIERARKPAVN